MTIADTIHQQLGGPRFEAMTGATQFIRGDRHLMMSLPSRSTKEGANRLRITLDGNDTYIIEMFLVRGITFKTVQKRTGVYVSQLRQTFTELTGLVTSLGRPVVRAA